MGSYSGPGPIYVIKGTVLEVACNSTGNPSPGFKNYTWTNDTTTFSGQILRLVDIDTDSNRKYLCMVNTTLTPTVGEAQLFSSKAFLSINVLGMY